MLIDSDELFDESLRQLVCADNERIALDTETTGIDGIKDGRDFLIGLAVGFYHLGQWKSYYYPIRHKEGNLPERKIEALRECLAYLTDPDASATKLIFHNAKFDIHSLATWGFDYLYETGYFLDTMVIAHMINEELPSKELDWLGKKYLDEEKLDGVKDIGRLFGWRAIPPKLMDEYSCQDVKMTYDLAILFVPELRRQGLHLLWNDEMEFIRMLARCEHNGLEFVPQAAYDLAEQGNKRLQEIENELGFKPSESTALARVLFEDLQIEVPSREEMPEAWTPGGKPSLNKFMMEYYDEILEYSNNSLGKSVLEYRGWQKAVSSWYEAFPQLCSPDGRIRSNFKPHGTRTGRLSSHSPNLQQLPRNSSKPWNGKVRDCFTSAPGFQLVKFDFKNLELRLAADYCGIEPLLEAFNNNGDPHQVTADRVGVPRNPDAKNLNFAMLYGAGPKKLAYMLNRTESEGAKIHSDFKESYPGFVSTTRFVTNTAKSRGYIKYWSGRRKHYNYYNRDEQHKSFNALIQGGGAEIVKHAALRCRDLESDDCRFVLTVHDELDFEIREDLVAQYIPEIISRMEQPPNDKFQVTFTVEHSLWGEKD